MPLLNFIRETQHLKGTKAVCREGDCGACTVLVGTLQSDGRVHYKSITSCISPLGNAHGKHIVTVEGVNLPHGKLNTIQQALSDASATQCGFCTPGFVLALSNMALQQAAGKKLLPADALSGNICRCTGYKSIERAAQQVFDKLQHTSIEQLVQKNFLPEYFLHIPQDLKKIATTIKKSEEKNTNQTFVAGGTDLYVRHAHELENKNLPLLADQTQLRGILLKQNHYHIGASTTVSELWEHPGLQKDFPRLHHMLRLISSLPIRNMATIAGNFVNASPIGDLSIIFLALNATLQLLHLPSGKKRKLPLKKFFLDYKKIDLQQDEIIESISFPKPTQNSYLSFEKVSKRNYLDIASVNSALQVFLDGNQIVKAQLAMGGVNPIPSYCTKTSAFLTGKTWNEQTLRQAAEILQSEINPISDIRGSASYKRLLAEKLLLAHLHPENHPHTITKNNKATKPPVSNPDHIKHLRGESRYVDDLPELQGSLHALVLGAPVAHGKLLHLDIQEACKVPGVVRILTAKDIPGQNQIGNIIADEPLLAEKEIHHRGQALAIILAENLPAARKARRLIQMEIEELPAVTTAEEAYEKGMFITAPRTFTIGDTEEAFAKCDYVFEGNTFTNGQEHLYLETQSAYALPREGKQIKIISSTQGPTQVQTATARVLGLPMHKVEVEVIRLGGGFGGKEDQATPWAVMAALGAQLSGRPVKLILSREDDLLMTGKRHPYSAHFKIGLDKNLKIKAYEARFLQNAGSAADLSPAVAERTLFHATNSYFIENARLSVYVCKTNLPPNTAFRGFGGPQGMFVIEAAIAKAAHELGIPAHRIQQANLLSEGDLFPYGQRAEQALARKSWQHARKHFHAEEICRKAEAFNQQNTYIKKGVAFMPVCFGISFTNTSMNQARALVHIYRDGSIGISTGAVEMGQGVNAKLQQIAAQCFSVSPQRIKIETTNTTRVANTSPSAASATTDLNGKALLKACRQIKNRLLKVAAHMTNSAIEQVSLQNECVFVNEKNSNISWEQLVETALLQRVSLSEKAHYATPKIGFDKKTEKGSPFAYHVYGTAIITATVDCLRGKYEIDAVHIAHDFGKSMNPAIDYGQVEGGLVQGIGWMTMEEVAYDADGRLLSNALSTYKIPDLFAAPKQIDISPLQYEGHEMAILKSKAVGEPPLMYGIGAYFALQNAMRAFAPEIKPVFHAPLTPEKVLLHLYPQNIKPPKQIEKV